MANEAKLQLEEIAAQVGNVCDALQSLVGALADDAKKNGGSGANGKSSEKFVNDLIKKLSPKGAKATKFMEGLFKFDPKSVSSSMAPLFDAMMKLAPPVIASTAALKLFAAGVNKATAASMEYRKAINANRAALNEASAGSVAYADAKKKETELINKMLSNSGLGDLGNLVQQLKTGVVGVLSYNWAEKLNNKLFGQKYSGNEKVVKMYDEMTGLGGYTESSVGNAIAALLKPMVSSGMSYDESKDLATALAYAAMGYSKKHNTGEEGFAASVEAMAQGMSSGSMYDIATGVRLDEDIMTGYAMKNGGVLPQYASDSVLMRERTAYITDAYITAYTGGAKAASDFSKELKKTGEVMNDIQETLFSFDEVIQLSAKVYEDVNDKVVESVDKSWTENIEGDTNYSDNSSAVVDSYNTYDYSDHSSADSHDTDNWHGEDQRQQTYSPDYSDHSSNTQNNYFYGDGNVGGEFFKAPSGEKLDDVPTVFFDNDGKYTGANRANSTTVKDLIDEQRDEFTGNIINTDVHKVDSPTLKDIGNSLRNKQKIQHYKKNSGGNSTSSNIKMTNSGVGPVFAYDTIMGGGGIALDDTSALIGEAGKEAVIPLESYSGVDYLANAMTEAAASAGGSIGGDTVNVTLNGTILEMNDYNVRRLGQKLAAVIENNKRRNGGV